VDLPIQCIVIDSRDCERLATFWSDALGWRITYRSDTEWAIEPAEADPAVDVAPDILFVKVPDEKVTKNRVHLDLRPVDQRAEVERLLPSAPATPTSARATRSPGSCSPTPRETSSASSGPGRPEAERSERRIERPRTGYIAV
jgi:hypothetical protein